MKPSTKERAAWELALALHGEAVDGSAMVWGGAVGVLLARAVQLGDALTLDDEADIIHTALSILEEDADADGRTR